MRTVLMQLLQMGKLSDFSLLRRTKGSIPFRADEHHKIGSVPFQSMTTFFHLRRERVSSNNNITSGFNGYLLIDKLNKLQSRDRIEPVVLGSNVANM